MRESLSEREEAAPVPALEPPEPRPRWPLVVVGVIVLFNLVVLRAEARTVDSPNDASVHRSMIAWASDRIEAGHLPFDGWYPDLALGSSRFHHYQSLPHILAGIVALGIGSKAALTWTMYLGMALWPIAVYAGGRLLGWGPWTCAVAAVLSPLIVSEPTLGYEWGSYAWRGYGTWTQLWGMWLLPFAWGLSWRAISRRGSFALAALVLALTVACHLLTGYLALLSLGVFTLVRWRGLLRRIARAAIVGVGSLLIAAWVVVPLLADRVWTVNDEYSRGNVHYDSFGARRILGWFASGELFDRGRPPMLTILVAAGIVVAIWCYRRDERARVLLFLFLLSLVLFFGRPSLGPVLRLLPGSGDLFLRRFLFGVHLAGLYLAGVAAVRLGRLVLEQARRWRPIRELPAVVPVLAVSAAVVFISPALIERASWGTVGAAWIEEQAVADRTSGADAAALVEMAQRRGQGRFYAGMRANWGTRYEIGEVPMYIFLLNRGVEGVGFVRPTWSLSSPSEYRFTDTNPAHFDLFDVRWMLLPAGREPPVPAERVAERGHHVLWEVSRDGYMDVVDILPAIEADRTNLGIQAATWLHSDLPAQGAHPGVAFEGHEAPDATVRADLLPETPAGTVTAEDVDLRDGRATVTVVADRSAAVLLKASFDPRWQVTVDGRPVEPQMIAPSFVGAEVSAGEHVVRFVYEPFPRYDVMFIVGTASVSAMVLIPRWLRRRRPPSGAAEAPIAERSQPT